MAEYGAYRRSMQYQSSSEIIGVGQIALGLIVIILAGVATWIMLLVLGAVLLIRGIMDGYSALGIKKEKSFVPKISIAVLSAVTGILLLTWPQAGVAIVSLFLGALFIIEGIYKVSVSVVEKGIKWKHVALGGVLSIGLGIFIFTQWPVVNFWLLGTLVGLELVINGWSITIVSMAVRKNESHGAHA
ncbi:DUF308 domain-containing protein [Chitinispirillales bacterium ANBcel5]|uniref:HdeD family acid-resistance protein n=1 Tax=Cellulosispirillum alkaliphilum TaxID=3039283 RepID=UPI002A58AEA7|nr:DUF308 domain-containing protein [Chitinispirillales bacterium ANBcel5]